MFLIYKNKMVTKKEVFIEIMNFPNLNHEFYWDILQDLYINIECIYPSR